MGFSKKAKEFFNAKGMDSNRKISKAMDNYSELLVGRYMNSDNISSTFIMKIIKYFPDADLNYLIKDDNTLSMVEEKKGDYIVRNVELVNEIEERIKELKNNLSPK